MASRFSGASSTPPKGAANRIGQIGLSHTLRPDSNGQEFPRFFFHGSAVAGCTHAELRFNLIVQASNGNGGHASNDSIAITWIRGRRLEDPLLLL
jgi:hypothetical protein